MLGLPKKMNVDGHRLACSSSLKILLLAGANVQAAPAQRTSLLPDRLRLASHRLRPPPLSDNKPVACQFSPFWIVSLLNFLQFHPWRCFPVVNCMFWVSYGSETDEVRSISFCISPFFSSFLTFCAFFFFESSRDTSFEVLKYFPTLASRPIGRN